MLEEEGYDVVGEAGDGEEAVAMADRLRPDLVILDVKMPKLDGIAAAERIAGERVAPVVILTAFSQRDLVERAREAGAMAYLVKPFQKKDLVPTIEMATSRFAEIVALEQEVGGLQERLEARKAVERAKGVLMTEHGMTEPEAFRWIQRTAMDRRTHHAGGRRRGARGRLRHHRRRPAADRSAADTPARRLRPLSACRGSVTTSRPVTVRVSQPCAIFAGTSPVDRLTAGMAPTRLLRR